MGSSHSPFIAIESRPPIITRCLNNIGIRAWLRSMVEDFRRGELYIMFQEEFLQVPNAGFEVKDITSATHNQPRVSQSSISFPSPDCFIYGRGALYSPPRNLPLGNRIIPHTLHICLLAARTTRQPLITPVLPQPAPIAGAHISKTRATSRLGGTRILEYLPCILGVFGAARFRATVFRRRISRPLRGVNGAAPSI